MFGTNEATISPSPAGQYDKTSDGETPLTLSPYEPGDNKGVETRALDVRERATSEAEAKANLCGRSVKATRESEAKGNPWRKSTG